MALEKHGGVAIRQFNGFYVQLLCPLQYMGSSSMQAHVGNVLG